jgi:hypothetical protein
MAQLARELAVARAQLPVFQGALPRYAAGTPYVPETGPALVHQGEAIIPEDMNPFINDPGDGGDAPLTLILSGDLADFNTRVERVVDGKKEDITRHVNTKLSKDASTSRLLPG